MNLLKHRFTSAKTDGADATQVQPSHWNDGHAFSGGNAGDLLTRDPTDAVFGATWAPPPSPYAVFITAGGTITLPPNRTLYTIGIAAPGIVFFDGATSSAFLAGARLIVLNMGTQAVVLSHLAAAVASGKLLNLAHGTTLIQGVSGLAAGSAEYVWDGNYWRMARLDQGAPFVLGLTNGNFSGFTCSSVAIGDYYMHGAWVKLRCYFAPAVVAAAVPTLKIVGLPFTLALSPILAFMSSGPPTTTWVPQIANVGDAGASLDLFVAAGGNWLVGSHYISIELTLPLA